ncbi:MAG: adenylate kinase [Acidobacteriota bacterium]|jgi:adenylate kinase|nr:adenylate kinase [Acidobacteriota bacterium]MDT7781097.1 adenylate kinase [Acidobacteriota bacterium]
MSKIIVMMGPPGSGKGTQARLLQERLGLPQISTGDMFRALLKTETPLAEELRPILGAGALVPDELTIRIVRERTSQTDCRDGYILDGFPRTPAQAEMLERLAAEQGHTLGAVLVDVPFEILERRVTGRRNCPVCKEIYNVYFKPPKVDNVCDLHPEAQLEQRADDNAETIKARLATYERDTSPLLDYYEKTGRLRRVDGTRDTESIYADIGKAVTSDK